MGDAGALCEPLRAMSEPGLRTSKADCVLPTGHNGGKRANVCELYMPGLLKLSFTVGGNLQNGTDL